MNTTEIAARMQAKPNLAIRIRKSEAASQTPSSTSSTSFRHHVKSIPTGTEKGLVNVYDRLLFC
jgi:hypothetical protein